MTTMLPGFTAETTLRPATHRGNTSKSFPRPAQNSVIPQMRIGPGGISTGGLGFHWPSWCEIECAAAAAICIAGTEGIATVACVLAEIKCLEGCNKNSIFLG
ncbi:MAG TPA: hypothetical protein VM008_13285 [Phycisphaerae bacterium]|nr:hypothetical protein [Phycisphaerae bacterium]